MPPTSKSQQHLFGAAEHGATFPKAVQLRKSMTHQQMHDFAAGSMMGKPERKTKRRSPPMNDHDEDDK